MLSSLTCLMLSTNVHQIKLKKMWPKGTLVKGKNPQQEAFENKIFPNNFTSPCLWVHKNTVFTWICFCSIPGGQYEGVSTVFYNPEEVYFGYTFLLLHRISPMLLSKSFQPLYCKATHFLWTNALFSLIETQYFVADYLHLPFLINAMKKELITFALSAE